MASNATVQLMTDTDGVDAIIGQWRHERPDLDTSPMGVIGRISRLCREIERRLEPVYAASGLEPGWYDVLATLRRAGPPYRVRSLIDNAAGKHLANERRILSGLSAEEQLQLADLLRKLSLTLPPEGGDQR